MRISRLYLATLLGSLASRATGVLAIAALVIAAAACGGGEAEQPPVSGSPAGSVPALVGEVPGDLAAVIDRTVIVHTTAGQRREVARMPASGPVYPAHPAWSPDGVTIAYVQRTFSTGQPNADWGDDIYLVPAAGGAPRLLRKHIAPGDQVQGLAWTPDGSALLFGHVVTLFKDGQVWGLEAAITRLELASGREQPIAEGGFMPSLSRDGKRLAYLRLRDLYSELVVANGDGSTPRVLIPANAFAAIMFPRIAPDGAAIVFAAANPRSQSREFRGGSLLDRALAWLRPASVYAESAHAAGAHGIPMDIWRIDLPSGQPKAIALLAEDEPMPVWSADGKSLVVFATAGLYRMSADGSNVLRLGDGVFGGQIGLR